MFASQIEGGGSLFSGGGGGGFFSSQSTQAPDAGFTKNRGAPGVLPLTVKQIKEASDSTDVQSNFSVDGVDATNIKLLGLVMSKAERATDVTFALDDGTGRIDVIKWVNESSDANETAVIQNGMYVTVIGSLKGFQEKKRVSAFSVRPVDNYDAVALHFIQCIHVHLRNTKKKGGAIVQSQTNPLTVPTPNQSQELQIPAPSQTSGRASAVNSGTDLYKSVMDIFQEPASLASDHGLHIDEISKRLGLPTNKIKEAIDYHIDMGNIYSTIDDFHFKSACID